ncbi:hypothetical protein ABZY05_33660 [Streptomyces canus]|uniref:hypothetical protein n=1 Tax=Streptomyces canus TaxID=58343 RepID=UPI0033A729FC
MESGWCLKGSGRCPGLLDGAVGDVGEPVGDRLDSVKPAVVDLVAAAGGGLHVQLDDFALSAFHGAGLYGRDEGVHLSRARACGAEKLGHTLFGLRGRLSVHGDQR